MRLLFVVVVLSLFVAPMAGIRFAAANFVGEGVFAASLDVDRLHLRGAVRLPDNPFGRYLNFTAILSSAEHVQAMTRSIRSQGQIMPPARDLPEGLSAAEFERRFDAVGSPAYRRIEADIEQRLDTIRLYQELQSR